MRSKVTIPNHFTSLKVSPSQRSSQHLQKYEDEQKTANVCISVIDLRNFLFRSSFSFFSVFHLATLEMRNKMCDKQLQYWQHHILSVLCKMLSIYFLAQFFQMPLNSN